MIIDLKKARKIAAAKNGVHTNGAPPLETRRVSEGAPKDPSPRLSQRALTGLEIPIENITPCALNPRKSFDPVKLAELAASIRAHGVLQAILVRPRYRNAAGKEIATVQFWASPQSYASMQFEIVAGERRWRAAQEAGVKLLPATVRDLTDLEVLEIAVIENEQRDDLGPLEKARGYQQLLDQGYNAADLAARIGKSKATIYGLVKLLHLPDKAVKAVDAGELSMSVAGLIARLPTDKARKDVAGFALRPQWDGLPSFRQVKDLIQRAHMTELKSAPFRLDDATLVEKAGSCKDCPKRTGNDPDAFPDSRADVCTDPGCYTAKLKAYQDRQTAAIAAAGGQVLEGKAAEKALSYASDYYDLKDQCYEHPKQKSYKQLLIEANDIITAFDQKGVPHRLIAKKIALPILKEQGIKKNILRNDSYHAEQLRQQKKAKMRNLAGREAIAQIVQEIVAAQRDDQSLQPGWLEILIQCAAEEVWHETRRHVLRRRGFEPKDFESNTRLFKQLASGLDIPEMFGLLTEILITKTFTDNGPFRDRSKHPKELCDAFGIDLRAIEKGLEEKQRAKGKTKNAKKPAKKQTEAKQPPTRPDDCDVDETTRCVVCGCTEDEPCEGGCYWAQDPTRPMQDVCSRCVGKPKGAG